MNRRQALATIAALIATKARPTKAHGITCIPNTPFLLDENATTGQRRTAVLLDDASTAPTIDITTTNGMALFKQALKHRTI